MADYHQDNVAEASMAKAHAARTAQWVTTRAMVLLGEEALEPDHPVEKWYRDAKIYDIFEGTGQIQRRIIAKQLLGSNAT
jgi:acyl-CoA dehydrogenase